MSKRMSVRAVSLGCLFATYVAGPRALGRRLFLAVGALPFVQLVETALNGTAMKEPLLPAVVANEPEPSVPNESLDRAARHRRSLLGRAMPKCNNYQVPFQYQRQCFRPVYGPAPSSALPYVENSYAPVSKRGLGVWGPSGIGARRPGGGRGRAALSGPPAPPHDHQ